MGGRQVADERLEVEADGGFQVGEELDVPVHIAAELMAHQHVCAQSDQVTARPLGIFQVGGQHLRRRARPVLPLPPPHQRADLLGRERGDHVLRILRLRHVQPLRPPVIEQPAPHPLAQGDQIGQDRQLELVGGAADGEQAVGEHAIFERGAPEMGLVRQPRAAGQPPHAGFGMLSLAQVAAQRQRGRVQQRLLGSRRTECDGRERQQVIGRGEQAWAGRFAGEEQTERLLGCAEPCPGRGVVPRHDLRRVAGQRLTCIDAERFQNCLHESLLYRVRVLQPFNRFRAPATG